MEVIEPYFKAYLEFADSHVLVFKREKVEEDDSLLSCLFSQHDKNKSSYIIVPYMTRFHRISVR